MIKRNEDSASFYISNAPTPPIPKEKENNLNLGAFRADNNEELMVSNQSSEAEEGMSARERQRYAEILTNIKDLADHSKQERQDAEQAKKM